MKITKKQLQEAINKAVKEILLPEESDPLDRGTTTDYSSMEELQAAMRKKIYEALQTGDSKVVTAAVREAVYQGAKFGYVTGWDKAWTEAEDGDNLGYY